MTIRWLMRLGVGTKHCLVASSRSANINRCCARPLCLDQTKLAGKVLLEEHTFKVPSFGGSLTVVTPVNVTVRPTSSDDAIQLEKAVVQVYGDSDAEKDHVRLNISQQGNNLSVNTTVDDPDSAQKLRTNIEVPMVHDVTVTAIGEGRIKCEDMVESNYCHLKSESGDIKIRRLKTANLKVESEYGDVLCSGAIQGGVHIVTGDGNVISDKRFIGPSLDISSDGGDIRVASSYSDQSKFSTNHGNLYLRNIHNESYVAVYESGNVHLLGVDGSTNVFVKKGDAEIQVSQVKHESRIHIEDGDINLKISDNYPIKVCVTANEIILDTKFSQYGKVETKKDNYRYYFGSIQPDQFSPTLQVVVENGRALVESQDWAASLGYKLPGGGQLPAMKSS